MFLKFWYLVSWARQEIKQKKGGAQKSKNSIRIRFLEHILQQILATAGSHNICSALREFISKRVRRNEPMVICIVVCGTVVIGCGCQVVYSVLQVLDHGIVSQGADHRGGVQVREEEVFGGGVFHHVPTLGIGRFMGFRVKCLVGSSWFQSQQFTAIINHNR